MQSDDEAAQIARGLPTCGTCAHHRPDNPAYPACAIVNVRSMWGQYALMPADDHEFCFRHEDRAALEAMEKNDART